ncbi:hypothetical protein STEG23_037459 [Scotinomys teguina]
MKGCWILSKAFAASNEMIMCHYIFIFISDFIDLDALSLPFALSLIISWLLFLLGEFACSCSKAFSFDLVDLSIGWNLPSSAFCKAGFVDRLDLFMVSQIYWTFCVMTFLDLVFSLTDESIFSIFVYIVYYIDRFSYVESSLHNWDEAYLVIVNNFLVCSWIQFVNILLSIFASMFMKATQSFVEVIDPFVVEFCARMCSLLMFGSYLMGFVSAMAHTGCMIRISFCDSNIINHYMCEIFPLLQLSCSSTYANELIIDHSLKDGKAVFGSSLFVKQYTHYAYKIKMK